MRRSRTGTMVPPAVAEDGWSGQTAPRAGLVGARRPTLPGGRVLIGGLLVAAAAVIVFASVLAGAGQHGRPYVVTTQALPAGTILSAEDLTTETMTLPTGTAADAFAAATTLLGRTLTVPVEPGQLIETSMLASQASATSLRPVSIPVATASLAGLKPGVPVDVLATSPAGSGSSTNPPAPVTIIVRGATLLSITAGQLGGGASAASTVVTLGVSDLPEVESLVQAAQSGSIVLIQAVPSDGVGPGEPPSS